MTTALDINLTLLGSLDYFSDTDEAEDFVDAFMDQIHGSDAIGPSVGATIDADNGTIAIEIELTRDGDDLVKAADWVMGLVRSSLHAVGVGTPGWEAATRSLCRRLNVSEVHDDDDNHNHDDLIPA